MNAFIYIICLFPNCYEYDDIDIYLYLYIFICSLIVMNMMLFIYMYLYFYIFVCYEYDDMWQIFEMLRQVLHPLFCRDVFH